MPDTIFALSSGRLPAGVAVIRISGPQTSFVCETISGAVPVPRLAKLVSFRNKDAEILDRGLLLWFPGPASFTGEDCAEFHLHGGRATVAALINTLQAMQGVREAEAGEFSKRAFFNEKVDLAQAEALGDLIAAETESQRRFALSDAEGASGKLYWGWRDRLIHARAMIEAELDFSDEGDVPGSVSSLTWEDVAALRNALNAHLGRYHLGEMIRDGIEVVIVGSPNAGKSSLLNALAARDAAIVSEHAGTTRDLIEVALDLGGYKVRLIDTAGIQETDLPVEQIGIDRALDRARRADLVIELVSPHDGNRLAIVETAGSHWRVGSKSDLGANRHPSVDLCISTVIEDGLSELMERLLKFVAAKFGEQTDSFPARMRHVLLLRKAANALELALNAGLDLELRAEELRAASLNLGRITGHVDVDDLLDNIFSKFCIGK